MADITFDLPKCSCFLLKMLLRNWEASDLFFRLSTGQSPASLVAVVLGLVSESWERFSD